MDHVRSDDAKSAGHDIAGEALSRGIARVTEEHDGAEVPSERERSREDGLRAGGVEDDVGESAEVVGERGLGIFRAEGEGRLSAARPRVGEATFGGVENGDTRSGGGTPAKGHLGRSPPRRGSRRCS